MTIKYLLDDLKGFIEKAISTYSLSTKHTPKWQLAPQVVIGALPPNQSTPQPTFPYIIIRFKNGDDNIQTGESIATINLILGAYSDNHAGYFDILSMIECIRLNLLQTRIIGNRYILQPELKYGLIDKGTAEGVVYLEQVTTHFNGYFELSFLIAQAQLVEDNLGYK